MVILPANRINDVQEYYFSRKLKEIDAMRSEGKPVLSFGIGSPDLAPSAQTIKALADCAARPTSHGYQSYIGTPALRQAFAKWYSKFYHVELNPANEILPLLGSKEGIMHISLAFLNAGDEVLVPDPGYPTYSAVCRLVEAKMKTYNLKEENNWLPDFDELERMDLSKVKLMWVNYPNMPTGTNATLELYERLVAFGKKHNILICNDNPYSFILNDKPISILAVEGAIDVALELNSLSKSHNMAGWRVGMVAGASEYLQCILRVKSNMDSGMFLGLQEAAVEALSYGQDWFDEVNKIYRERRELVFAIMDTLGCTYDRSQSGLFVWGKIPSEVKDSEAFSDKFLYEAYVFFTPGIIFGENGRRFIRISLCQPVEILKEALERIKKVL